VKKAQEAVEDAKKKKDAKAEAAANEALKLATERRDPLKKYVDQRKAQLDGATTEALEKQWKNSQVYSADAFRLLVRGPCLACHTAGGIGQAAKGPPLDLSAERLRPEWTLQWLANPRRMTSYQPAMPQNFPHDQKDLQGLFQGTSREQVEALRDLLMDFPRQAALPVNRYYLTSPGGK
jgi:mono/diheme cytochrome c family protein